MKHTVLLLTRNSSVATATLSDALAARVTRVFFPKTVPSAGEVRDTVGGVLSVGGGGAAAFCTSIVTWLVALRPCASYATALSVCVPLARAVVSRLPP